MPSDALPTNSTFVVQYQGDLERDHTLVPSCHDSFEGALREIARHFTGRDDSWGDALYPDPEDDRITVMRCTPGEPPTVVWHFSGWHWDSEAADLPGGPLPQGSLPGSEKSLYELAMRDE